MSEFQQVKVDSPAGVNFTREPAQLPLNLWDEAYNVTFRHGKTYKSSGYEQGFGTAHCRPEVIVPLRDSTQSHYWWNYAGEKITLVDGVEVKEDRIYQVTSKGDHDDVTPEGGIIHDNTFVVPLRWSGGSMNTIPYMCKGKPYVWSEKLNKFKKMNKFPEYLNFRLLRTYKNYMVGLNFETKAFNGDPDRGLSFWDKGTHPNALWWSQDVAGAAIEPSLDWEEDPDNEGEKSFWCDMDPNRNSGWNFLGGLGGPIVDAKALRDSFMIYRERSVWQMTYVGGVNVFAFKELFDDAGALGENCVVEVEGQHYVVGQSDIYVHNGVQKQSIADGIVRREIFKSIDPSQVDKVFCCVNYKDKEFWVCIPESGSFAGKEGFDVACNVAYVYNWVEKHWSRREVPNIITTSYTLLSINESDVSWESVSEGGPAIPDGDLNPNNTKGHVVPGGSWEETVDTWLDSFYKYNPSDWGLVFGSNITIGPDSYKNYWDEGEDPSYSNEWTDPNYWIEEEPPEQPIYTIFTSIEEPLYDGYNKQAIVEKRWMDLGDRSDQSFVNKIYPLVRNGTIDVYMSGTRMVSEEPVWKFIGTFDPNRDTKLSCRVSGCFIHVRFIWSEESRAEVRGYNLEFSKIGRRE